MTGSANLASAARVATVVMASYLCASAQAALAPHDGQTSPPATAATLAAAQQKLSTMSLPFVPNGGQWDARAAFAAQTFAGTLFVTKRGELVYSLPGKPVSADAESANPPRPRERAPVARTPGWALSETLVDANGQPRTMSQSTLTAPAGYRPMEGKVSYAIGTDTAKHTENLNTYERVNLGDMYPGVNVQLRATHTKAGSNVEKIFTVAPLHDPKQIQIKLAGAQKLEVGDKGELIAHTGNGPVAFTAPIAFQEVANGEKRAVKVNYALDANAQTYGFTVGDYDTDRPLVIDPLLQSTYLGGSGLDSIFALTVHPHTGEIYVAGTSGSTNFPGVSGGAQAVKGASTDAFVARFNASLTALIQSTYLGGGGDETAYAITVHPATGDVYIAGTTTASDLPGTLGAAQPNSGGGIDVFAARFSATLTTFHGATYIGGSAAEAPGILLAVAVHPLNGDVYVAGSTQSSDFPFGVGAAQPVSGGDVDAFVVRLNPALTVRAQSTFLGGSGEDRAYGLSIHPGSGVVYVTGFSWSTNFPGAAGGAQGGHGGSADGFISRLNASLTTVTQSTYFGGTESDTIFAIAMDLTSGDIVVAGTTSSSNLPGVSGAAQSTLAAAADGFVARFNAGLTTLRRATYIGGTANKNIYGMAVNSGGGDVLVAGTVQPGATMPGMTGAIQPAAAGGIDGFVTRLDGALTTLQQSTYFGGGSDDYLRALVLHPTAAQVYAAGYTFSSAFAVAPPTAGAQPSLVVAPDGFIARFSADLTAANRIPDSVSFIAQSNVPANSLRTSNEVRLVITPLPPSNQPAYVTGQPGSQICATNTAGCCTNYPAACSGFVSGWSAGPYDFLSGDYIAVRHNAANPSGTAVTHLMTGGVAIPFVTSTGNAATVCNLDANADNALSATKEGLILVRAMLGLGADAIVAGTGVSAWEPYRQQLNAYCGTNFPFSPSAFQ